MRSVVIDDLRHVVTLRIDAEGWTEPLCSDTGAWDSYEDARRYGRVHYMDDTWISSALRYVGGGLSDLEPDCLWCLAERGRVE